MGGMVGEGRLICHHHQGAVGSDIIWQCYIWWFGTGAEERRQGTYEWPNGQTEG